MSDPGRQNLKGALMALVAMGVFATHDVVVKYLGASYSAIQIIFFASLLSFPLISILILQDKSGGSLRPRNPGWVATRTVTALITGITAFYAFGKLPLAQTYALLFSIPLLITILSVPILGETVRIRRWIAVIVGLIGVLIVLRPGHAPLSLGHLAGLIAALTGSLTAIIVRKLGTGERPVVLLFYPLLGNFFVNGSLLALVYQPMPISHLGLMAVIAAMGLTGSLLSILSYRMAEAVIAAPMQYSQMIWATAYGYLLFNERLDRATLVGSAVIIGSGLYIVMREARPGASAHHPVTSDRSRNETVTTPRPGLLYRILHPGQAER